MLISAADIVGLTAVSSLWLYTPLFLVTGVGLGVAWSLMQVAHAGDRMALHDHGRDVAAPRDVQARLVAATRCGRRRARLQMTERDPTLGEVVGGDFERHLVASDD